MKLSKIHDERAQGVVEFAFIVSVLMMLFVGTVDYARFLYYDTAIRNAARVGAETASNHCAYPGSCGQDPSPVSDTYILWSTYCESNPYVSLNPAFASSNCQPGSSSFSSGWTPSCTSSAPFSCSPCVNDVCVSPGDGSRSSGTPVTVTVGYKFHPIAFLLDWVFTPQSCFSGDTTSVNGHTLCASATGRVS